MQVDLTEIPDTDSEEEEMKKVDQPLPKLFISQHVPYIIQVNITQIEKITEFNEMLWKGGDGNITIHNIGNDHYQMITNQDIVQGQVITYYDGKIDQFSLDELKEMKQQSYIQLSRTRKTNYYIIAERRLDEIKGKGLAQFLDNVNIDEISENPMNKIELIMVSQVGGNGSSILDKIDGTPLRGMYMIAKRNIMKGERLCFHQDEPHHNDDSSPSISESILEKVNDPYHNQLHLLYPRKELTNNFNESLIRSYFMKLDDKATLPSFFYSSKAFVCTSIDNLESLLYTVGNGLSYTPHHHHNKGVFAEKDIKKGQVFSYFEGVIIPSDRFYSKYTDIKDEYPNATRFGGGFHILGHNVKEKNTLFDGRSVGSLCNDVIDHDIIINLEHPPLEELMDTYTRGNGKVNTELVHFDTLSNINNIYEGRFEITEHVILLRALTDIKPKQEIYISRGYEYWLNVYNSSERYRKKPTKK